MATTINLPLTATRYRGTGVDTQVTGDYVGNVYAPTASGSMYAEHYRMRLSFRPGRALSGVVLKLAYGGSNNSGGISYYCTAADICPEVGSTNGKKFSWSGRTAEITLTQRFEANKTYYLWVWSSSYNLGYVVLTSYSAVGTVAAPTMYVKTDGGWTECEGLYAKGADGWTEADGMQAKTDAGWQEA